MDKQTTYYRLFPTELHRQVDEVINYLTYFPFEQPKQCTHCGSTSFYSRRPTQQRINVYQCYTCGKEFNRLTGTLFMRCRFMNLWGKFAAARFSGKTVLETSSLLGMSYHAVRYRDKVLMQLLKENFPDLYSWWKPYHEREEKRIKNAKVNQQAKILTDWLDALLATESVLCPNCTDRKMRSMKNQRLSFICDRCGAYLCLLTGTPFYKFGHAHKWQPFLELFIQGDSNCDISRKLAITIQTAKRWRDAFTQIIKEKELNDLYEWIVWQKKRSFSQAIKLSHQPKK